MVEGYPKYAYSPCPRHMQLAWSVKVKSVIKGGLKKGIFGKTLFKIFSLALSALDKSASVFAWTC